MEHMPGMVLINRIVPGYAHRCVGLDNVSGALMATRMLLNHGHQRIGYLSSNHGIEDDELRREGWFRALHEHGIVAPESWVGSDLRICRAARRRWSNCWGATSV